MSKLPSWALIKDQSQSTEKSPCRRSHIAQPKTLILHRRGGKVLQNKTLEPEFKVYCSTLKSIVEGFYLLAAEDLRFSLSSVSRMFKKFSTEEVSAQNQVKASVQRKIRQSIADEYPGLEQVLEDLIPKKSPLIVAKWFVTLQNHLNLVVVNNVPLFFNIRDGPYMPTLRLLHQDSVLRFTDPDIMKKLQVDRGAIRFVLSGANIMCPGLTSPGGALDDEVGAETPVAIMAEGKQHALAIGFTKMSAKEIRDINKGIGVDNMHYLNDVKFYYVSIAIAGVLIIVSMIHISPRFADGTSGLRILKTNRGITNKT
ncbi:hypothetical protein DVH24_015150 [Malus domestica]|uniref:PUA domain-containing protein n=1 Tax=Malus domestica TaxID=3750 RepID=A0A498K2I6_MALDO|nr:hypothetical protein DVH24_015150 [Malus domestica]